MEIIYKNPDELIPYPNNTKLHPEKNIQKIAGSIKEFGFKFPILITKDDQIICGHGRVDAAKLLKLSEVPCICAEDLTESQIKALRIADNRLTEDSTWDNDLLKIELDGLKEMDFDISVCGFDTKEMNLFENDAEEDDFDSEQAQKEPKYKVERGEIYLLGEHRLMCGDSTSSEDVEKLMNGEKADMVFTDPPYGVSYGDKNKFLNAVGRGNHIQENIEGDCKKPEEMYELWIKSFKEMYSVLREGGSYYICAPQGALLLLLLTAVKDSKLELKQSIIWRKNNIVLGRSDYKYQHEPIIYGWKGGIGHKFYGESGASSVWELNKPQSSKLHPTMKPVELVSKAILNSSLPDNCIIDLFGGSGTTLIACEQLNRKCFMMEIDPLYCSVIIERWETLTNKKAVKYK